MTTPRLPTERHTLKILGLRMEIESDDPGLIQPFLEVFDAFVDPVPAEGSGNGLTIRIDDRGGTYDDGLRRIPLASEWLRPTQVYNLLYVTMVRSLADLYLLHGAVVAHGDLAFFLGGPSGSGKSTLAHRLVNNGFGFLSDDLAPLSVADGRIHPFPRRLGFVRASMQEAGLSEQGARVMGAKAFLGAEDLGARVITEPLEPGAILLMNPYTDTGPEIELSVGLLVDPGAFLERLSGHQGIEAELHRQEGELALIKVRLTGAKAVALVEEELRRAEGEVMFHFRGYGDEKAYADSPSLERLSVPDATMELLRETLNREPQGALMGRLGGSASAAFYELVGLLTDVPCFRLTPGPVEETTELVARTFRDIASDG